MAKIPKNLKISYVKIRTSNVTIKYDEYTGDSSRAVILVSEDKPRKSFVEAFANLADHVVEMCEMPVHFIEDLVVTSLTLKYEGERNTMGAVISASKKLRHSKSPFNLSTPYKTVSESGISLKGDSLVFLTPECQTAIGIVAGEAKLFIEGARLDDDQLTIFNEFKPSDKPFAQVSIDQVIEEDADVSEVIESEDTKTPKKKKSKKTAFVG